MAYCFFLDLVWVNTLKNPNSVSANPREKLKKIEYQFMRAPLKIGCQCKTRKRTIHFNKDDVWNIVDIFFRSVSLCLSESDSNAQRQLGEFKRLVSRDVKKANEFVR